MTSLLKPFQGVSISFSPVKCRSLVIAKMPCEFLQPHLMLYSVHSSPGLFAVPPKCYTSFKFCALWDFLSSGHTFLSSDIHMTCSLIPCHVTSSGRPSLIRLRHLLYFSDKLFFFSHTFTLISFLLPPFELLVSISVCSALETVHHILY